MIDVASEHDIRMMQLACAQSRLWMGASSPNPAVGAAACDVNGQVLAADAHRKAGQPHGEINVLTICRAENSLSRIDTLYVTLEPCNHHGRTPPCSAAIIEAGIRRVVIGARDPNPHVAGGGLDHLRQAGIDVVEGVNEQECLQSMHAFFHQAQNGQPWITVKRAFDGCGSMIPPAGQKTFTSQDSLRLAHLMRKKCDAVITGSGTVLADMPDFTVRHVADYSDKRRWLAILDRRGRVPDAYLRAAAKRKLDAIIYRDIDAALDDLARKGAQDILIEAGPKLSQAIIDEKLWTLSVDIHSSNPDRLIATFNVGTNIAFNIHQFDWNHFLPREAHFAQRRE